MPPSSTEEETQQIQQQRQWLLDNIPATIAINDLSSLTQLDLPNLGLTELPSCLPTICPQLSILFCPKNKFVEVPAVIGSCQKLQMVSFKECFTIERIAPEALQPQLRWLILTGNKITTIPTTIERCTKLQKLMLSGNRIEELPASSVISKLQNLELIRLACNQLREPPVQLLKLCQNLRWAAFAGNPFLEDMKNKNNSNNNNKDTAAAAAAATLQVLPVLDDPVLDHDSWPVLGKGAGGVTRKVPWNGRNVAVKTFAGELTSDGSPQDEKYISKLVTSAATANNEQQQQEQQQEPALIELLGETKQGGALVMEFLDGYKALAGPPSFETCSRDVYGEDDIHALSSSEFRLWKIAIDTLRVLSKLHGLGVSHADFYAHNILIQPKLPHHKVKVSDFGAAFRYRYNDNDIDNDTTNDDDEFGRLVERVEVRAYTVLVEELYDLAINHHQQQQQHHPWKELIEECQKFDATFGVLVEQFNSID